MLPPCCVSLSSVLSLLLIFWQANFSENYQQVTKTVSYHHVGETAISGFFGKTKTDRAISGTDTDP